MSKFIATSAPKCPICEKSVYKMEEILAINKSWHKACFTCGVGGNEDGKGCGRTLQKGTFLDHQGNPYCNTCYNKNFKPKGFGYGSASLSSEVNVSASTGNTSSQTISAATTPSTLSANGVPIPPTRRGSGGSMGLAAMLVKQNSSSDSGFITTGGGGVVPQSASASTSTSTSSTASVSTPVVSTSTPTVSVSTVSAPVAKEPPVESAPSPTKRPSYTANSAPKCEVCSTSVYKMEEILALKKSWHKHCFTCGVNQQDGCGRTLQRDNYLDHDDTPYCTACYNKNFKAKGFGYGSASLNTGVSNNNGTNATSSVASSSVPKVTSTPKPSTTAMKPAPTATVMKPTATPSVPNISAKRPAFAGTVSPKCPVCDKSVYKMEEILAMDKSWHKGCFTCGVGDGGEGCGRTMQKGTFLDHQGTPYCNSCYNKNFKPKGFGYGSASLSSPAGSNKGDSQSGSTNESATKQNFRRGSGGSAALAARLSDTTLSDTDGGVKVYRGPGSMPSSSSSNTTSSVSPPPPPPPVAETVTKPVTKPVTSPPVRNPASTSIVGSPPQTRERRLSIKGEEQFQGDGDEVDDSEW